MDIELERILSIIPKKENGDFKHGAFKEFATSIGLKSGNLISDWINGRSKSYTSYLYKIADIYDVSVEYLKGETDIKEKAVTVSDDSLTPEEEDVISIYRSLSPEQKEAFHTLFSKK